MSYEDYLHVTLHNLLSLHLETGEYDIGRPDYTRIDGAVDTPYMSAVSMMVDIGAGSLLDPPVSGLAAYSVWVRDKNEIKRGDVLTPCHGSDLPTMTVAQNKRKEEIVAFRTNRVGRLLNSTLKSDLYTNVYFEWYRPIGTDAALIPGLVTSPEEEQRNAVLYYREGIKAGYRLIDDKGQRWRIQNTNEHGVIMTMTLLIDAGK